MWTWVIQVTRRDPKFWFSVYSGWPRCKLRCTYIIFADKNIFKKSWFSLDPKQLHPWKPRHFSFNSILTICQHHSHWTSMPVGTVLGQNEPLWAILVLSFLPSASDCVTERQEWPKWCAECAFCNQWLPIREVWVQPFCLMGMNCLSSFFPCSNSPACAAQMALACISSCYGAGAALAGSMKNVLCLGMSKWVWTGKCVSDFKLRESSVCFQHLDWAAENIVLLAAPPWQQQSIHLI